MADWLEKYHYGIKIIENNISYIDHLFDLFYEIGNEKISAKLNKISIDLSEGLTFIKESHNENFNEQIKQVQQSSANVFNAVIAGMKLKKD